MSIAYGSGGRHRPVDVSADDGEEIALDGTRLKQLRVERGLSVSEAARLVTLSREQVEQIENGGLGAFYGARHKLLAARKYAEGYGITLEEILPKPPVVPEPVEVPAVSIDQAPAAPHTEAVIQAEKASEPEPVPESEPISATVIAPIEQRISEVSAAPVVRTKSADDITPAPILSETTVKRLPLALVVGASLILVFSILRGLAPTQEVSEPPRPEPFADTTASSQLPAANDAYQAAPADATAAPEVVAPASAVPSTVATPAATPASAAAASAPTPAAAVTPPPAATATATAAATAPRDSAAADACAVTAGPDTPRWAPDQGRNSSTRVFVTSVAPIDVCVTDANGTSTPLKVKPGAMSSATGKPPYIVRSERLAQAQIFLQGLKVRVPSSAVAVHLFTTQSVKSPESPVPSEQ